MNPPKPPTNGQLTTPTAIRSVEQMAGSFYAEIQENIKAALAHLDEYDIQLAQTEEEQTRFERAGLAELREQVMLLCTDCRDHKNLYNIRNHA